MLKSWAPALWRQAITDSQFGQQNAWPGRIDLNFFAQVANDDAQIMGVIKVRTTPDLLHDLLTRDDLAHVLRKNLQDLVFLRTKNESPTADRAGAGSQIDLKRPGLDDWIAVRRRGAAG